MSRCLPPEEDSQRRPARLLARCPVARHVESRGEEVRIMDILCKPGIPLELGGVDRRTRLSQQVGEKLAGTRRASSHRQSGGAMRGVGCPRSSSVVADRQSCLASAYGFADTTRRCAQAVTRRRKTSRPRHIIRPRWFQVCCLTRHAVLQRRPRPMATVSAHGASPPRPPDRTTSRGDALTKRRAGNACRKARLAARCVRRRERVRCFAAPPVSEPSGPRETSCCPRVVAHQRGCHSARGTARYRAVWRRSAFPRAP